MRLIRRAVRTFVRKTVTAPQVAVVADVKAKRLYLPRPLLLLRDRAGTVENAIRLELVEF